MIQFRLNEFKAIAKWLRKTFPRPLAYFLTGWLYGLETSYIAAKASSAVDKGIAPYIPHEPVVEAPSLHSEPSEVEGLDIIQLTAPWNNNNND